VRRGWSGQDPVGDRYGLVKVLEEIRARVTLPTVGVDNEVVAEPGQRPVRHVAPSFPFLLASRPSTMAIRV